jgi:hypothetical protein
MQWFRFYAETISDKKLRRIARDVNEPIANVIGVWTIVLAMASDSPIRGRLMISADVPATIDDISDAAGCNVTETFLKLVVTGLVTTDVTDDGHTVYVVTAWDKRQYESDSSATRVKRHRERQKVAKSNADVTLQSRFGNTPDTDTDTDTDTLPTTLDAGASSNLSQQFQSLLEELKTTTNKTATLRQVYVLCFGESAAPDFGYIGKTAKQVGGAGRLAQLMFELVTRPPAGDILAYIVAQENGRKARAKQNGGNREILEVQFTNGDDIYA